jgi:hypothetical protein
MVRKETEVSKETLDRPDRTDSKDLRVKLGAPDPLENKETLDLLEKRETLDPGDPLDCREHLEIKDLLGRRDLLDSVVTLDLLEKLELLDLLETRDHRGNPEISDQQDSREPGVGEDRRDTGGRWGFQE